MCVCHGVYSVAGAGEGEQGVLRGLPEEKRRGSYKNGDKTEDPKHGCEFFQVRYQRLARSKNTLLAIFGFAI